LKLESAVSHISQKPSKMWDTQFKPYF